MGKYDLNELDDTHVVSKMVKYYNQESVRSKYQNHKYAAYTYRCIDHKLAGGKLADLKREQNRASYVIFQQEKQKQNTESEMTFEKYKKDIDEKKKQNKKVLKNNKKTKTEKEKKPTYFSENGEPGKNNSKKVLNKQQKSKQNNKKAETKNKKK